MKIFKSKYLNSPSFAFQLFSFSIARQDEGQTIGDNDETGLGRGLSGIGHNDLRVGHFDWSKSVADIDAICLQIVEKAMHTN